MATVEAKRTERSDGGRSAVASDLAAVEVLEVLLHRATAGIARPPLKPEQARVDALVCDWCALPTLPKSRFGQKFQPIRRPKLRILAQHVQ